jgi:LacI family transcriptional regulator
MANIRDVAVAANVSPATVSRVINGGPVNAKTRERVQQIIHKLDFKPNASARSLGLRKAGMIGVIVPSMVYAFYSQIVEGIARSLAESRYEMALRISYHKSGAEEMIMRLLGEKRADALIIITPRDFQNQLEGVFPNDLPAVFIDGFPHRHISAVSGDNFDGGYQAGRHLIALGHRDLGVILGPRSSPESEQRLDGFRFALNQANIELNEVYIRYADYMTEGGQKAAIDLLDLPKPPSAIFCVNDLMAYGLYLAAESRGINIPAKLSVVGYDDSPMSQWVRPTLTSVRQPTYAMGEKAVSYILDLIQGRTKKESNEFLLPVELINRSSTAAIV